MGKIIGLLEKVGIISSAKADDEVITTYYKNYNSTDEGHALVNGITIADPMNLYDDVTGDEFAPREGYDFVEWNTERDGTGTSYEIDAFIGTSGLVLYAIWTGEEPGPGPGPGPGPTIKEVSTFTDSEGDTVYFKDSTARSSVALLNSKIGNANGIAELDSTGKVPTSQLPSYVDDVLEYDTRNNFPATGESGKIYIAKDTNKTYRWSGSTYVEISESLALGDTSSTAYRGDRGKTAYDHATAKGSAFTSGFYKIATNSEGHVTSASGVTKSDITNLGIPGEIQVHDFDSLEDFPAEGAANNLYIDDDTNMVYRWDAVNEEYVPVSGSGGSSALNKIPFTIEASDWTSDLDGYNATIQNTRISSSSEELVLYDSSIANMPGNISVNKSGNSLVFSINALPSVSLNGTIYSLVAEAIVIDSKLDVNQGAQNAGKILEVNNAGNLTPIENPFTIVNGVLNVIYYKEVED